jgi:hypothetical protein
MDIGMGSMVMKLDKSGNFSSKTLKGDAGSSIKKEGLSTSSL